MSHALSAAELQLLRRLSTQAVTPEKGLDPPTLQALVQRGLVMRLGEDVRISSQGRSALARSGSGGPAASARPGAGSHRTRPEATRTADAPRAVSPFAPVEQPASLPAAQEPPAAEAAPEAPGTVVNERQEDLLRRLVLEGAAVPVDDLDGRVIRALEGRGLVRRAAGQVEVTDEGRAFYESKVRRRRRARSVWARTAAPAAPAREAEKKEEKKDEKKERATLLRNAVESLRRVVGDAEEIQVGDLTAPAAEALAALLELAERIERGDDPRRISPGARR